MNDKYDVAIIGGGPGGYEAAIRSCQYGLKVAVIEEREMGGTCLNRGCIPTKSILHSAEVYNTAKSAAEYGVLVNEVGFDYAKIAAKKDTVVKKLRSGVEYLVKSNGGEIYAGRAYIKDRNSIEVTGKDKQTITADKIIIATGSRPAIPPIPGMGSEKVLDSDKVLAMTSCPDRIIIIGGGVIGIEFATAFNTFGKEVTIIEMLDTILSGQDDEIIVAMRKSLEKKGIKIYTSSKVTSIKSGDSAVCEFENEGKQNRVEGDIVIAAVGRKPNTSDLGLENIGLKLERRGFIIVNERMETDVKGVFAIGDVTGKIQLAHVASAQGMVAAANAAGQNRKMDYSIVPSCIYTSPEIASVGLTEAETIKKGYKLKIGRFPVNANGRSMIIGEKEGFVKIITDENTGEVLGTHIMAPRATDMISEISVAMKLESTIEEIADVIHPHPTVNEMILEAAHDVGGLCINKPKG